MLRQCIDCFDLFVFSSDCVVFRTVNQLFIFDSVTFVSPNSTRSLSRDKDSAVIICTGDNWV